MNGSLRDELAAVCAALNSAHDFLLAAKQMVTELDLEDPHVKAHLTDLVAAGRKHAAVVMGNGEAMAGFQAILEKLPTITTSSGRIRLDQHKPRF